MTEPRRDDAERRVYRLAVGTANLALAAGLVYGAWRFGQLLIPKYGMSLVYVPIVMLGLAVWMIVRGVLTLRGGAGGE